MTEAERIHLLAGFGICHILFDMVIWYFHSQVTCVCRGTFLLTIFACLSLYKFWKRNFLYYYPLRVVSKFACWILFLQRTKLIIVWRRRGLVLFFFPFSAKLHQFQLSSALLKTCNGPTWILWIKITMCGFDYSSKESLSFDYRNNFCLLDWNREKKALLSEVSKSFQSPQKNFVECYFTGCCVVSLISRGLKQKPYVTPMNKKWKITFS